MEVIRILKRDVGGQFATSRNMREGLRMRVKRAFWSVVYTAKGFRVGLSSMRREALGERIIYDGRKGWINNWAGSEMPSVVLVDGESVEHADRSKMKTVGGIQKYAHRFRVGFGWYMASWFGIDVNQRLYR